MSSSEKKSKYVLSVDVGTTKVRALIYNEIGSVLGQESLTIEHVYPRPGWDEINPDKLWQSVQFVIKTAIEASGLSPNEVTCMGISCQRCTFVTWNKSNGKEFHNFITWKDLRSDALVKEFNNSITMKSLRRIASLLFFLTQQSRFKAGSIMRHKTVSVALRLVWALQNIPNLKESVKSNNVMFGTVDTWLIYKLTKGQTYLTDVGSVSATGLFDPFTMSYMDWMLKILSIPINLFPPIVDSAGSHFGSTHPDIFAGTSIPIRSVMADQSAAVFGSGCFNKGDIKMTLGSGSFLDATTGHTPHASLKGIVPLVGWRYQDSCLYLAEGSCNNTCSQIEWGKEMNFFDNLEETSDIASSIPSDTFSLYFIPAFFGLNAPINDNTAGAGFIGITPTTGPKEMLRALLESIAFNMKQIEEVMEAETDYELRNIQVDGGVSKNDFIIQMISDLTGKTISRATSAEMSAFGAAFLAGIDSGVWGSKSDLSKIRQVERIFQPNKNQEYRDHLQRHYQRWVQACHRFTKWNI